MNTFSFIVFITSFFVYQVASLEETKTLRENQDAQKIYSLLRRLLQDNRIQESLGIDSQHIAEIEEVEFSRNGMFEFRVRERLEKLFANREFPPGYRKTREFKETVRDPELFASYTWAWDQANAILKRKDFRKIEKLMFEKLGTNAVYYTPLQKRIFITEKQSKLIDEVDPHKEGLKIMGEASRKLLLILEERGVELDPDTLFQIEMEGGEDFYPQLWGETFQPMLDDFKNRETQRIKSILEESQIELLEKLIFVSENSPFFEQRE